MRYEHIKAIKEFNEIEAKSYLRSEADVDRLIDMQLFESLSRELFNKREFLTKKETMNFPDLKTTKVGVVFIHPDDFKELIEERDFYKKLAEYLNE